MSMKLQRQRGNVLSRITAVPVCLSDKTLGVLLERKVIDQKVESTQRQSTGASVKVK